ncbi:zinc-finger protein [Cryphonectria parasitica EP155]|uniref:Zinc-finger protein n=1 Tax=Cryphonectria parasitica (strain ATCC 38755 / EP155) TaxID=660469 RepID=A0A9P5CTB3_CRYP1|nr:zinc-finger protein [Cryphonectria parasitica EP155]KAF3770479.1 zinc-finger protein [Cryphonectria parasitica EP155]
MACLQSHFTVPEESTAPGLLFQWRDEHGNLQPLGSGYDILPVKISEYLASRQDWAGSSSPTVEGLLARNSLSMHCRPCVDEFRRTVSIPAEEMVEIRDAGIMGMGAFAKVAIPKGTPLGEYLGELLPANLSLKDDLFSFSISDRVQCTAMQFGNWARFMNHHCTPNVSTRATMYGRRYNVVLFRAGRDIAADEHIWARPQQRRPPPPPQWNEEEKESEKQEDGEKEAEEEEEGAEEVLQYPVHFSQWTQSETQQQQGRDKMPAAEGQAVESSKSTPKTSPETSLRTSRKSSSKMNKSPSNLQAIKRKEVFPPRHHMVLRSHKVSGVRKQYHKYYNSRLSYSEKLCLCCRFEGSLEN